MADPFWRWSEPCFYLQTLRHWRFCLIKINGYPLLNWTLLWSTNPESLKALLCPGQHQWTASGRLRWAASMWHNNWAKQWLWYWQSIPTELYLPATIINQAPCSHTYWNQCSEYYTPGYKFDSCNQTAAFAGVFLLIFIIIWKNRLWRSHWSSWHHLIASRKARLNTIARLSPW